MKAVAKPLDSPNYLSIEVKAEDLKEMQTLRAIGRGREKLAHIVFVDTHTLKVLI